MKTTLNMVKINLRQSQTVWKIMIPVLLMGIVNYILFLAIPSNAEDNSTVAIGNFLYLLPALMAILIPAQNFSKMMNLGGKRKDFFKGCILSYTLVVAIVTAISIVLNKTIDRVVFKREGSVMDLLDIFGFMENGIIVAFFQMTAFLILFCCVAHTLTLIQSHLYGWIADVIIIAIISVFTPIASLRASLIWFFNMIIFNNIAIVQIISCLVLAVVIYCLSIIPIKSKSI